ncbi:MAG: MFS transporter [Xanthomonadales bacterium]|jgi:MFS family permease|nr:MFS transporter [Xanthomonadales bacterium]
MLSVLRNRSYRRLFLAQIVALAGTGLATIALGLLAFDLAGGDAGRVLGTALAIKMIAYVTVAPIAAAWAVRFPRRTVLVVLDGVRLGVVLALPWVDQIWQIYALIFLLQAASAGFTPLFQATIPEVLPNEADYTRALSLSRLAYDLESLLSPTLAALLLLVISYQGLFLGTAAGFFGSALLVLSVGRLPVPAAPPSSAGAWRKLTRGTRLYLATPRLRGLLALTMAAAAGSAMVIVNTVVIVRDGLVRPESAVAIALAAFGAGSMLAALLLPRWLERHTDRATMIGAAQVMTASLAALAVLWRLLPTAHWPVLLVGWFVVGATYSAVVTPGGRLLRRSAHAADLPTLFAAQFSLSHACWLVAYPLVGALGASAGMDIALAAMAALAAIGTAVAWRAWPAAADSALIHSHPDLSLDHPHWREHPSDPASRHAHPIVIDDLHVHWPAR